ncbi:MAG: glycosyltransferase family 39 protein [Vicinamibacterales bacterium]
MTTTPRVLRVLAAAAAVGLGLRLLFALGYWTNQPLTRDEHEYLSIARSLVHGNGFVYDESLPGGAATGVGRAPGYPLFLAFTGGGTSVVEAVPTSVKVAQAAVGIVGVLLLAAVAGRLAGPTAAAIAALLGAVHPPLVWVASYVWSEALAWPLGLASVWLFDRLAATQENEARTGMAAGLVTGLTILVRPGTLLFVPAAAAWLAWRRRTRAIAWLLAGCVLVIAPWTMRNYAREGRLILVASEGGVTFWTGNHPLAAGDGDLSTSPALKAALAELQGRYPARTGAELEPVYYREALRWMREHPWAWLELEVRKAFFLVVPVGPSYAQHSIRYAALSIGSYLVLLPLAAAGFVRLGSARARAPGLWLLGGSAVLLALIFFPQERFRIPVIDPLLIVCASVAIAARWSTSARADECA